MTTSINPHHEQQSLFSIEGNTAPNLPENPQKKRPNIPQSASQWRNQLELSDPIGLLQGSASYYPHFLPTAIADQCLNDWQHSLPWQQNKIKIYGREVTIPRLESWLGQAGLSYQYSGKQLTAQAWPAALSSLAQAIGELTHTSYNSVLANLYRGGEDSMGWHSDDEIELGPSPIIASVTLGQARDFAFRLKGQSKMHSKIMLGHGSLLIMHAGMQERWQHALPKRSQPLQPRLNLTFRRIIQTDQ